MYACPRGQVGVIMYELKGLEYSQAALQARELFRA